MLAELEEKREQLEQLNQQLNETNRELNEANAKLRELAEMKEEFLALTTHDLRSPLTVISGVISFFTSGRLGELSPEQQNMVAMMERNTQSLIELVNDLLDASKLESGTMRLDIASIDLRGLVDELRETMAAAGERERASSWSKSMSGRTCRRVEADRRQAAPHPRSTCSPTPSSSRGKGGRVEFQRRAREGARPRLRL